MKVNSAAQVANLNADKLDNLDASLFVRSTYGKLVETNGGDIAQPLQSAQYDPGDFVLSGGYAAVDAGTQIMESFPSAVQTNRLVGEVEKRRHGRPDPGDSALRGRWDPAPVRSGLAATGSAGTFGDPALPRARRSTGKVGESTPVAAFAVVFL